MRTALGTATWVSYLRPGLLIGFLLISVLNIHPGLLQRRQAHAYIKMEAPLIQANWLKISMPVLTEAYVILQEIGTQISEEFNLIQNLNFGFKITLMFLSVSFFSLIFIFFLTFMKKFIAQNRVAKPNFNLKKIVSSCLRTIDGFVSPSSSMAIFIIIFNLYLWLFMLMVVNAAKTNKVVRTN